LLIDEPNRASLMTMAEIEPQKMRGTTLDIAAENRARLKQLFPTVFTETRDDKGELIESIDFGKLKAELGTFSDMFESRRERYGMEWPGKKEALRLIQTLSLATLKPCRDESVNFDTTENLFIEGDNLEVLKLLQTSYYGKVKMIYIDPPYNTGKEFIYPDNYSESLETYLEYAGLIDGEGKKFSTNTANEGRFHTRWLNMMYPRLYLARNLLRDDGVIIISIDDNEVSNLRKLCDEIFGEENFVGNLVLQTATDNNPSQVNTEHEYIVCYSKNRLMQRFWERRSESALLIKKQYDLLLNELGNNPVLIQEKLRLWINANKKLLPRATHYDNVDEKGVFHDGDIANTKFGGYFYDVIHPVTGKVCKVPEKGFRFPSETLFQMINSGDVLFGPDEKTLIKPKKRIEYAKDALKSIIYEDGRRSTKNVEFLLGRDVFKNPKSHFILSRLIEFCTGGDDIVLDFFAGSGSTAHAILDLNKEIQSNRHFIMVQLPEVVDSQNVESRQCYKFLIENNLKPNLAEIGKERIRRVINKLNTAEEGQLDLDDAGKQDRGFKVFKLDKSNFRQWQKLEPSTPSEKLLEQLSLHIDHINPQSTPEELLYELLLKAGFTLTDRIETKTVSGKKLFSVSDGALLLCLEERVTRELIDAVIELNPQQFLCLDSAFHGNDQLKANAVQTFAAHNMQKDKQNQILFKTV